MKPPILLSALVLLSACDPGLIEEPPPPPEDPCAPGATIRSDQTRSVDFDGDTRSYRVHVPPGYQGGPTPLALNFHGLGSNGIQQELLSQMDGIADAEGVLVAYPEGTGVPQSWNGGVCCSPASSGGVDDVAFAEAVIDDLSTAFCVDQKRVFATGMSNGGFLTHRLGCELSDRIAAIAPVAGVLGVAACAPPRAVPVIQFHGTLDPLVPFDGNATLRFPPVAETIDGWAARNGCQGAAVETFRNGDSHCETFQDCAEGAEVTLCTVEGGGHNWPGGTPVPELGFTTQDLNASQAMLEFFLAHPLP
jgi:polyhydroxybutyrate depolymerase